MRRFVRLLGCAAAFSISLGTASAAAQTVIVRSAPPGATLETIFDTTAVGTGTVNAQGDGTVTFTSFPITGPEGAAAVHVDICGTTYRIRLASRAMEPPVAGVGCDRRSVPGYFVIRPETTLVIDVTMAIPTVRIAQGRPPNDWLREGGVASARPPGRLAPSGLGVFGGVGIGRLSDAVERLCGNASTCKGEDTKMAWTAGATYWLGRFIGAEAAYVTVRELVAIDDFENNPFTSTVDPRLFTVSGLVGLPLGPARFYGRAGVNLHRATFRTVQVITGGTITVDGVNLEFPSTSQTFLYDTVGWGPIYGGGIEGWVSPTTAVFGEFTIYQLKGENTDVRGTRTIDEPLTAFLVGVKIQITGR